VLAGGADTPDAFVSGYSLAFWVGVAVAVASVVATLVLLRREELTPEAVPDSAPA